MENGFFEEFECSSVAYDDRDGLMSLNLKIKGHIPIKQGLISGVSPIVDPNAIIETIKHQIDSDTAHLKSTHIRIETTDWPKWSRDEMTVVGSRGTTTSLGMFLTFAKPKKARPR